MSVVSAVELLNDLKMIPDVRIHSCCERQALEVIATALDAARLAERQRVLVIIHDVAKRAAIGGPVTLACMKIAERFTAIDGGGENEKQA